jgi:hypothetical protein
VHIFVGKNRTTLATMNNVGDVRPWLVLASTRMWMWNKSGASTDGYTVHTGGGDKSANKQFNYSRDKWHSNHSDYITLMKATKAVTNNNFPSLPCDSSAHTFFTIVTYVVTYFPFWVIITMSSVT